MSGNDTREDTVHDDSTTTTTTSWEANSIVLLQPLLEEVDMDPDSRQQQQQQPAPPQYYPPQQRPRRRYRHHYDFQDRPPDESSIRLLLDKDDDDDDENENKTNGHPPSKSNTTDENATGGGVVVVTPTHSDQSDDSFNHNNHNDSDTKAIHNNHRLVALDKNNNENDNDDSGEDPVRIRVGGVDFVHSASWLRHVVNSPVLNDWLLQRQHHRNAAGGLNVPHRPATDWLCLRAHLLGRAQEQEEENNQDPTADGFVDWDTLPTLVAWSWAWQLHDVARECDAFLSRHVLPLLEDHATSTMPSAPPPPNQLLLLCRIALRAHLPETAAGALTQMARALEHAPGQSPQSNVSMLWNEAALWTELAQLLCQCLQPEQEIITDRSRRDDNASNSHADSDETTHADATVGAPSTAPPPPPPFAPPEAALIFVAAIAYLPPDCRQDALRHSNSATPMADLLTNPLFPHLARQGMLMQQQQQQYQQANGNHSTSMIRSPLPLMNHDYQDPDSNNNNNDSTSRTSGALQHVAQEWQAGFHKLLALASVDDDDDYDDDHDDDDYDDESHTLNNSNGTPLPTSHEVEALTEWLERIWQGLGPTEWATTIPAPPPPSTRISHSSSSNSLPTQPPPPPVRRTFAC